MGLVRCGDTERYRNIAHYAQYTGYGNLCIRCLRNGIDVERCAYKAVESTSTMAADPIVQYMSRKQLEKSIERTKKLMQEAAKKLDFIEAAQYRDEVLKMEELLKEKDE